MTSASKIQNVTWHANYDKAVHCPFCGALPEDGHFTGGEPLKPCQHTLFAAFDLGWLYVSPAFERQLHDRGMIVERDEDSTYVRDANGEDVDALSTCAEACFPDAVMFTRETPPPGDQRSCIGFGDIDT